MVVAKLEELEVVDPRLVVLEVAAAVLVPAVEEEHSVEQMGLASKEPSAVQVC